jgi:hypothetical protein
MQPTNAARIHARRRRDGGYLGATVTTADPALRLAGAEVRVAVDRFGREALLVPDTVARYMRTQVLDGWTECGVSGTGHSRAFTALTHMFALAATLAETFAASDPPAEMPTALRAEALHDRERVAAGGTCYAQVVGAGGWDATARDYVGAADLHVPGSPYRVRHAGLAAFIWRT